MDKLEEKIGYRFKNRGLLVTALTHSSYANERHSTPSQSYERLEFLGDSILGAVVARSLFESYPEFDEGKLTRLKVSLVSGATLSEVSHELGIDDIIIFGASETGTGARGLHSALENVYESLVGALYLDAGWDAAAEFIHRTLKPHLASERAEHPANPKSFLQECVQADGHEPPYMGEDREYLVRYAKDYLATHKDIDYFMFGHRHIELDLMLSRKTRLMILGDWIWQFTYAVFDGEHMFMETYVEGESQP